MLEQLYYKEPETVNKYISLNQTSQTSQQLAAIV